MTRCAVAAGLLGEPLAGSAPHAPRWLAVEHRGAWGREVTTDADAETTALATRAAAAGFRLVLMRRHGRGDDARVARQVYLADTTPGSTRLTGLRTTDVAGVDVAAFPGEPVAEPVLLVCAHGRRDRCCAIDGRALVAEIAGSSAHVWESSHLGGHRFAPTALVLPTGHVHGRLDASAAVSVLKAAAAGEVDPHLCRGRSTWDGVGQVADLAVRERTGERGADALTVESAPGHAVVRHVDGRAWRVVVERRGLPGRRAESCGKDAKPITPLVATAVTPL